MNYGTLARENSDAVISSVARPFTKFGRCLIKASSERDGALVTGSSQRRRDSVIRSSPPGISDSSCVASSSVVDSRGTYYISWFATQST